MALVPHVEQLLRIERDPLRDGRSVLANDSTGEQITLVGRWLLEQHSGRVVLATRDRGFCCTHVEPTKSLV